MQELIALEERIGNVNTGLADEKISGCVMEVACCSSARLQNDKENASCVICLVRQFHVTFLTAVGSIILDPASQKNKILNH
jgi:hypothetical protein